MMLNTNENLEPKSSGQNTSSTYKEKIVNQISGSFAESWNFITSHPVPIAFIAILIAAIIIIELMVFGVINVKSGYIAIIPGVIFGLAPLALCYFGQQKDSSYDTKPTTTFNHR